MHSNVIGFIYFFVFSRRRVNTNQIFDSGFAWDLQCVFFVVGLMSMKEVH